MKSLLTSRPELRWFALAVPTLVVAHWLLISVFPHLVALVPESVRTILHLL